MAYHIYVVQEKSAGEKKSLEVHPVDPFVQGFVVKMKIHVIK